MSIIKPKFVEIEIQEQTDPDRPSHWMTIVKYQPEVKEGDENTKNVNVLKEVHVMLLYQHKMLNEHIMFSENNNILLKKLLDKLKSYEDEIEQLKEDKKNLLFANEMWKDSFNYFVNHNQ